MLGVVATLAAATSILKWQKSTTVLKEVMPARMEESLAGLSRKGEEAIFTTTYYKHGQRRAGKFCFHFDGDSIIILSDMLRHGFKKRTCHQSLAVHGNLPHLPNGKKTRNATVNAFLRNTVKQRDFGFDETICEDALYHAGEKKERKRKLNAIHSRHKSRRLSLGTSRINARA
jgi:hypothetical protein